MGETGCAMRRSVARGRNLKRGHPDDPEDMLLLGLHATMLLKPVNEGKHMASGLSSFYRPMI